MDKNYISQAFSLELYGFYWYDNAMKTRSKSKGGRPPKKPDELRSEDLLVKLMVDEKEAFKDAAALAGVPLSSWVRERLRQVAIRELESAARPIAFLKHLTHD